MTVRFYLKGNKSEKGIFLMIRRYNVQIYTKQKIQVKDWDSKKQRAKRDWIMNDLLDVMAKIAMDVVREKIKMNIVPDKEMIVSAISKKTSLYKTNKNEEGTVYDYAVKFMNINTWGKGYTKHFKSWINLFNKLYPGLLITSMDYTFYRGYAKHLLSTYKKNTANTHWRKFKRVLDDMVVSNTEVDQTYKKVKVGTESVFKVFLSKAEIKLWYDKLDQLPDYVRNASALFLIGCNSALRYGDFKNVQSSFFYKDDKKYYRIMTTKTKTMVTVPGNDMLDHLLSMSLHEISNQKMNMYIKEGAKLVGIDEMINVSGSDVPKYSLIETHTARRSFATNAVLDGIPISFIMSVTGHKTEYEFRKYVRVDDIMNAVEFGKYMDN